jgi:two-component system, NarL family, response regulator LiaR
MNPMQTKLNQPTLPIRVVIADDHAVVREGLRALLGVADDMLVVGEAENGAEAIQMVLTQLPDLTLLDLVMPQVDGISAIRAIKDVQPTARIVILTSFAEDSRVFAAIQAGAQGYLLKDTAPQQLLQAIRDVHSGHSSLHPTIAAKVLRELAAPSPLPPTDEPLTEREMEVLKLVAHGWANSEIGHMLTITERTVSTHVSNILAKLHLASRTQAALYALQRGLARLEDANLPQRY